MLMNKSRPYEESTIPRKESGQGFSVREYIASWYGGFYG